MDTDLTIIKNQPASAEVRRRLKDDGRPVLVAFSGGKDAIATELALREDGIETVLAYMYLIPGDGSHTLEFVEDGLHKLEDHWQKPIHRYPHPSLYRWLNNLVFQPPERIQIIEAAQLPNITYADLWTFIKRDLGLPADTWIADGVRASDSIVRRASFVQHGLMKPNSRKVSPIADWKIAKVRDIIARHHVSLPADYEMFGRSFDGIDYRFLKPIKDRYPNDYRQILQWFPLADAEIFRRELAAKHHRFDKELPL